MNDPKEKREIAQSEARDKTSKIISSFVPGGTAAYELLTTLVVPLHEKKKREFINDLAIRLKKLEDQGEVDFEELAQNEEFNTIITKAILLAQQNHQKEKLEALRNVVINSVTKLPKEVIEFDEVDYFLSILERINPIHLTLLDTFNNPKKVIEDKGVDLSMIHTSSLKSIFLKIHPRLSRKSQIIDICWNDLNNFGLVEGESLNTISSMGGRVDARSTELGGLFLEMITYPD